jgi:hypothetical protein
VFPFLADLSRYPSWLTIVTDVAHEPESEPAAWSVELRGRLGPLARSKRLRMVRTLHQLDERAVFERLETDGRSHAKWRLDAAVTPTKWGSNATMHLSYDGALFGPVVERLLRNEIEAAKQRLVQVAQAE